MEFCPGVGFSFSERWKWFQSFEAEHCCRTSYTGGANTSPTLLVATLFNRIK